MNIAGPGGAGRAAGRWGAGNPAERGDGAQDLDLIVALWPLPPGPSLSIPHTRHTPQTSLHEIGVDLVTYSFTPDRVAKQALSLPSRPSPYSPEPMPCPASLLCSQSRLHGSSWGQARV